MSIRSFKRAHARRLSRERRRAGMLARRGRLLAGTTLTATTLLAASAEAQTYTVLTNADGPATACPTPATCPTLRDAITAANADTTADTINFASGVTGTITLTSGALPISGTGGLTISGPGASVLSISGATDASQIFQITVTPSGTPPANFESINGLTLTHGTGGTTAPGGAIEVTHSAPLSLTGDTISDSTTAYSTGGGGIETNGPLLLSQSTVSGNTATGGPGGGLLDTAQTATLTSSAVSGNSALNGGGVNGENVIVNGGSMITGNHATAPAPSPGKGGGIDASSLTLDASTVSGNSAIGAGGGVLVGQGKYATKITGATITGNTAGSGGGLATADDVSVYGAKYSPVLVQDTTVSGNQAPSGAGLDFPVVAAGQPVTLQASTISGNQGGTSSFGGGILIAEGASAGSVQAPFRLLDSTVSGNTATTGAGVSLGDAGHEQLIGSNSNGSVDFDNSTIAANTAATSGGGIYLGQYSAGSPATEQSGTAALRSTIVSGNRAGGAANDLARAAGSTSGGFDGAFSLVRTPGSAPLGGASMITGRDPLLGPLQNNGGPTKTMAPASTSPVLDQGHAEGDLTTDQRGAPRTVDTALANPPGGDGTDIGAVELPASDVYIPPAPGSGFKAKIGKVTLGSGRPLLVGHSTPVTCSVQAGTLSACVIEVRGGGKLLASGEVISSGSHSSLTTQVTPTAAGLAMMAHHPLGLDSAATTVGSTNGAPSVRGNVHFLAGPSINLRIGSRTRTLSRGLTAELNQIAKLLAPAKHITCTAYTNRGRGDVQLTRAQAKAACRRLTKDGYKGRVTSVGKGHTRAPGNNARAIGTANRRLIISFTL